MATFVNSSGNGNSFRARIKKISIGLIVVCVLIQFVRPSRNVGEAIGVNEISKKYAVPGEIHTLLQKSCYDCHSNKTNYPWYSNIQPVGWWIQGHINEGKEELNFSEFATYSEKNTTHLFEEIEESITEGWMPMSGYVRMHEEAKLTDPQRRAIAQWAASLK